jgi:hypothetical protein
MNALDMSPVVVLAALASCVSIDYTAFEKPYTWSERERAIAKNGTADTFITNAKKAQEPHWTDEERRALWNDGLASLRSQMGSMDYQVIGHVFAKGEDVSMTKLKQAVLKRAAREGGDVVLFFRADHREQQWSYTTPGYATTNVNGSGNAYTYGGNGNYYTNYSGQATAQTTYTPPQTYYGTTVYTAAEGYVLRYEAGFSEYEAKFEQEWSRPSFRQQFQGLLDSLDGQVLGRDEWRAKIEAMFSPSTR